MYKSHGKAYPKWLQTSLDRNWDGVAWNLIQGMAQCFFTQWLLFVWEKNFQTICYYDSWLCHALPWAKWNWLLKLSSARSGPALAPKEWGPAKLLAASPGVYLCFVPARLEDLLFFFSLFITSVHIQSTRKECLEFCCLQQQCRTCTGAPSLSGTKPAGYLNISASNSSKQMFGFQSNFSLCYSNLEIFPSQVPNLHSSIWAGNAAGRAATFFFLLSLQ